MTCKSNVFKKKKSTFAGATKPSTASAFSAATAYCSEGLGQLPVSDPVCLSVSPPAAASSKAMSCHALLPLSSAQPRPGSLRSLQSRSLLSVTVRQVAQKSDQTQPGKEVERERKQNKTKEKESKPLITRVIALFRVTICQRFTKLYDTR